MKLLSIMLLMTSFFSSFINSVETVDPTGTYILKGAPEKNIIKGRNGEIRARLLEDNRLALSFSINKGYPKFENAFFSDTVFYDGSEARYHSPKDADCTIVFHFEKNSVDLLFIHSEPQCSCGFGEGLIVPASFQKFSSEPPVINSSSLKQAS